MTALHSLPAGKEPGHPASAALMEAPPLDVMLAAAGLAPALPQDDARGLRALAYELAVAETRERERVAQGLHDEIGQSLSLILLKLGELRQSLETLQAPYLVEQIRGLVVQAARATRSATFELNCPVLQQLGLQAALGSLAQRMERLFGLCVMLHTAPLDRELPPATGAIVFRVVRELLVNARRHGQASTASVRAQHRDDGLAIVVSDDGVGFDPRATPPRFGPQGGFGLFSAQAQARALGGRLEVESAPGRGTVATLSLPFCAEAS